MQFTGTQDERTLTELDHVRLERLLRDAGRLPEPSPISAVLDAAQLVPSQKVEPDVVTMGSQVLLADAATGKTFPLTLCYPSEANPSAGFVSVLSPIGASLIGLRIGDIARWRTPVGEGREAHVTALLFQPEASGLYTL